MSSQTIRQMAVKKERQKVSDQLNILWVKSLAGDQQSYVQFLEMIAKLIRQYLGSVIPRNEISFKELIEDLTQDVLVSIHQKKHTFQKDSEVLPWVFAIAKYRWIDHRRLLRVKKEILPWDVESAKKILETFENQNATPSPEDQLDYQSTGNERMDTALKQLTKQQHELIKLAKLDELPLAEVAVKMGLSLSAVKVGVHRAVAKLRKVYENQ